MCFEDFVSIFKGINVCWVKNWEEVRIKGKFIWVQNVEDPAIEVVLSKWYYSLDINEPTWVILGLHQEDERIQAVNAWRPYLDIGIAVLRWTNDNNIELVDLKDFGIERQVELELTLEAGSYIILPWTTGCMLWRPVDAGDDHIQLIDSWGNFDELFESAVQDIFWKFDMLLNRELSYTEFRGFYECIGKNLTESEFKNDILDKYCST